MNLDFWWVPSKRAANFHNIKNDDSQIGYKLQYRCSVKSWTAILPAARTQQCLRLQSHKRWQQFAMFESIAEHESAQVFAKYIPDFLLAAAIRSKKGFNLGHYQWFYCQCDAHSTRFFFYIFHRNLFFVLNYKD